MKNIIKIIIILFLYLPNIYPQSTPDGLERERFYDVQHILIKISFDENKKIVFGECTTTLQPLFENFTNFDLDAIDLNIKSVKLENGKDLKFKTQSQKLKITLDKPYSKKDKIVFTVVYSCSPKSGLYFVQPDSLNPNKPRQIWTQGQGRGNDNWFPMYNYFNDKTTTETIVTVKENYTVLSNGKLIDVTHDKENKTKTFHWMETKPHATYLVMLAIGEYSIIEDNYKNIPVQYYVYKGREDDAKRCFRLTPDMIKFFSETTGFEYPWEKYAQVCIADFMFGGMENTSATTLNDIRAVYDKRTELDYQNTSLVAHELAHQWWGDLITQKDGISHWLQEGFATYFDALYHEYKYGKDEYMRLMENNMQAYKDEEARLGKIPMVSKTTPFVYVKGASVLHMLRFILGDEDFFRSIKSYTQKFAFKNVTSEDFENVVKEVTGKDYKWFFDEWLLKAGYPKFLVSSKYIDETGILELNVRQMQKYDSLLPVFNMPIDLEITTALNVFKQQIVVDHPEMTFLLVLKEKPLNMIFDKGNWIVKDLEYNKSKDELLFQLQTARYAFDRKVAIEGLKKFLPDPKIFAAISKAALSDPFWTVRLEAIDSIMTLSGKDGIKLLLKTLHDTKSAVRTATVLNLRNAVDPEVSKALRETIKTDSSYFVVSSALITLAMIDSSKAFDAVVPFIKSESFRNILKSSSIDALSIINDRRAIPYLFDLARKSEPSHIREKAISTLALFKEPNKQIIEFLTSQFSDPDERIRTKVYQVLSIVGTKEILPTLENQEKKEGNTTVKDQINKAILLIRSSQK